MAHLRPTVEGDVFELAPNLRAEDLAEIKAASGEDPLLSLLAGYWVSRPCFTIIGDEGEVVAMWGVNPAWDGTLGVVWMLASHSLPSYRVPFLRECHAWADRMNTIYPVLANFVDERNTVHVRWLRWLGFTFLRRHERYGIERRPFLEFARVKPCAS